MSFTRRVENFKCRHCGQSVQGNGYANHCPFCLWSRHVDIEPGDRLEICRGMMEPIRVTAEGDGYKITHRCQSCGDIRQNIVAREDDFEVLARIASN